mmetsp:Transcript_29270/g.80159  ORF Transcript_29270/g.80159 Transcript_29270/m.80159 type:complete len:228 (-) Transcript_29270:114-797(-)
MRHVPRRAVHVRGREGDVPGRVPRRPAKGAHHRGCPHGRTGASSVLPGEDGAIQGASVSGWEQGTSAWAIRVPQRNDFFGKNDTRMAQRWPPASRPARDARKPCAPARGAPVVSTPEAPCPTRASPHARSPCCLAHCAPRRQARDPGASSGVEQETATKATEKHESMVDLIEAAPIAAKDAHARHPRPAPNRTETVPCRAPFPQASTHSLTPAQTRTGDLTFWSRTR